MLPDLSLDPSSFVTSSPLAEASVTTLPFPSYVITWFSGIVVLLAVLFSLAIIYHWLTYSKHALLTLVVLVVYVAGCAFFVGQIITTGFLTFS